MFFKTNISILLIIWLRAVHLVVANNTTELQMTPYFTRPNSMDKIIAKPSGNMVRFVCNVVGYPEPKLTWTKNNESITREIGEIKYRKFAIILENLIPSDSGLYKCNACNDNGCIEHSTKLNVTVRVNHAPFLVQVPENLTLLVGQSSEMKCTFFSDSHSILQWIKGKCDNCVIMDNMKIIGSENNEILRFDNVRLEDTGWYTCIALNSMGRSSASAYLTVVTDVPDNLNNVSKGSLATEWTLIVYFIVGSTQVIMIGFVGIREYQAAKQKKNLNLLTTDRMRTKSKRNNTDNDCKLESTLLPIIKIEEHRSVMLPNSDCHQ